MSSIAEKKAAKNVAQKEITGAIITEKITYFLYVLLAIFIYLLLCFIFSPTLLYSIQFINEHIVKKNIKYDNYETFEQYFNDIIICGAQINKDGSKSECNSLPYDKRPLSQNIPEAFKASMAKSFFASRDIMVSMLKVFFNLLDYKNTLNPEIFSSKATPSSILENLTNIKNDRKVSGVIGKTLGTMVVLLWPSIYYILWVVSLLWGTFSSILTFFTTINKYTLVKTALIFSWPIVFWWLFMIPPMLSLISFIVLLCLLFMVIFMLSFGSSIYNLFNIATAFYWLPTWLNKYLSEIIKQKSGSDKQTNMNKLKQVQFQGVDFEWPSHAKEFSTIYYFIFVVSNIINIFVNFIIL
jgi:hypothetical protein